jgi:hypothetical protein
MAALLRQTGGAVVVPHDDHAQLVGVLERLAERGTLETPPINVEEVRRYERRNLTGVLARTLDEVCRAATARGPSS